MATKTAVKQKYVVFRKETLDYGNGHVERRENKVGETYAVSPKKAVSNIMFRLGLTRNDLFCEWSGDGYRSTEFVAVPD